MFNKILAASGLFICIALAVHMALRPALQRRVEASLRRMFWRFRDGWQSLRGWRRRDRMKKTAAIEAALAIEQARARSEGEWDGNVFRPKRFDKDKRH